ncbi:hypothetical protein AAF712_014570 [Marasmius tenuissimus]|uniref:Uncharacterized protein n=1 Tax=Marasmius tenuissimus TaxID=585030 RepID=A0ABR2ZBU7_9AGAR
MSEESVQGARVIRPLPKRSTFSTSPSYQDYLPTLINHSNVSPTAYTAPTSISNQEYCSLPFIPNTYLPLPTGASFNASLDIEGTFVSSFFSHPTEWFATPQFETAAASHGDASTDTSSAYSDPIMYTVNYDAITSIGDASQDVGSWSGTSQSASFTATCGIVYDLPLCDTLAVGYPHNLITRPGVYSTNMIEPPNGKLESLVPYHHGSPPTSHLQLEYGTKTSVLSLMIHGPHLLLHS